MAGPPWSGAYLTLLRWEAAIFLMGATRGLQLQRVYEVGGRSRRTKERSWGALVSR